MRRIPAIVVLLLLLQAGMIHAQIFAPYSQHYINKAVFNPAAAGIQEIINGTLFVRREWTAFPGMPTSNLVLADMPVNHDRMGIGLRIGQQTILASNNWEAHLMYAYKINVNKGKLAFGLNLGVMQYAFNTADLRIKDADDKLLNPITGTIKPDIGFGVMYCKSAFYLGASTFAILGHKNNSFNPDYSESKINNSFYIHGGNKWRLSDVWALDGGLLFHYEITKPVFFSSNVAVVLKKQLSIGTNIRSNKSLALVLGINLKSISRSMESMTLGYSYDLNFSELNKYLRNTHEVTLNFRFNKPKTVKRARLRPGEISPYDL